MYVLLLLLVAGVVCISEGVTEEQEKKLWNDVFNGTNEHFPPHPHADPHFGSHCNVSVIMAIDRVISVDSEHQTMEVSAYFGMQWVDSHHWDPDMYGGKKSLNVHPGEMWHPDIVLLDCPEDPDFLSYLNHDIHVKYTGEAMAVEHGNILIYCKMPDAIQIGYTIQCKLEAMSWNYPVEHVNLTFVEGEEANKFINFLRPHFDPYFQHHDFNRKYNVSKIEHHYYHPTHACCTDEEYTTLVWDLGVQRIH